MASEVQLAAAAVNAGDVGSIAWGNPTRILTDNGSPTEAVLNAGESTDTILVTDWGFVAVTGTVDGVALDVERQSIGNESVDETVQLTKNGTTGVGDNKADTVTPWPATYGVKTYGGAADGWTASLTAAEVAASTFGVRFKANYPGGLADTVDVDYMQMTVYYTAASTGQPIIQTRRRKVQHLLGR